MTEDGAVLVSPEAGDLRVLNRVGATIWQLLNGTHDIAALQAELVRRYGISESQAKTDLDHFLGDLQQRGLLSWKESDVD